MKPENRKNDLAAIHMAQKALDLSKDDAEALKLHVTGVASAGDMTPAQRGQYLAHLSGLQTGKPVYTGPRRAVERSASDSADGRWRKARVLWGLLAQAGVVDINTDAAMAAWIKGQTKVDAWRFLNGHQINTVIESLKKWCLEKNVPFEG